MFNSEVLIFPNSSSTTFISCLSWDLSLSSQNTVGKPVDFALFIASFIQSLIASFLTRHILQISPVETMWVNKILPSLLSTHTFPFSFISKVLSCDPYSSAFFAIRPTFWTVPIVAGWNAPFFLQKSMVAW